MNKQTTQSAPQPALPSVENLVSIISKARSLRDDITWRAASCGHADVFEYFYPECTLSDRSLLHSAIHHNPNPAILTAVLKRGNFQSDTVLKQIFHLEQATNSGDLSFHKLIGCLPILAKHIPLTKARIKRIFALENSPFFPFFFETPEQLDQLKKIVRDLIKLAKYETTLKMLKEKDLLTPTHKEALLKLEDANASQKERHKALYTIWGKKPNIELLANSPFWLKFISDFSSLYPNLITVENLTTELFSTGQKTLTNTNDMLNVKKILWAHITSTKPKGDLIYERIKNLLKATDNSLALLSLTINGKALIEYATMQEISTYGEGLPYYERGTFERFLNKMRINCKSLTSFSAGWYGQRQKQPLAITQLKSLKITST